MATADLSGAANFIVYFFAQAELRPLLARMTAAAVNGFNPIFVNHT